jgi:hypothetical protein
MRDFENAPLHMDFVESGILPESGLPEILEPDLDGVRDLKMLKAELAYAQGLNAGMKENVEKLKGQNEELKKDLAYQHDDNRQLRKRIANLIWVEETYNREQAHKPTDWFLLLALGGVLGWAAALIVSRVLGWF